MVQGIRSSRGHGSKSALFQPMFAVEFEGLESPRMEMHRFREVHSGIVLQTLPFDIRKTTIALFMAEVLYRLVKESEPNPDLFDFAWGSVEALDDAKEGVANFHLWFLDRYAAFLGFPFERGFNLDFNPFTPEQTDRLRSIHEASFGDALSLPMTGVERKELIEAVIRWLEFHTGSRIDLRSLSVLHQISKLR